MRNKRNLCNQNNRVNYSKRMKVSMATATLIHRFDRGESIGDVRFVNESLIWIEWISWAGSQNLIEPFGRK